MSHKRLLQRAASPEGTNPGRPASHTIAWFSRARAASRGRPAPGRSNIVMANASGTLLMDRTATPRPRLALVEDFAETVNQGQFKEAFDMAKEDGSYLARVLTTGMGRLRYGIDDAREAAFNVVESVKAGKEQAITYLATIGTLGPMIGLVGTVWGMILSFMELSRPGTTPRPEKLAEGISHALVVTLLGIGLSVPAIFCHAFFRNRLIR